MEGTFRQALGAWTVSGMTGMQCMFRQALRWTSAARRRATKLRPSKFFIFVFAIFII